MGDDNEKGKNTAAIWGFWGTVIAALIAGLVTLIVAGKIPFITQAPTPTQPSDKVFIQNFDNSEGSFDTSLFECPVISCNAQNVFQRNGTLVFKFNNLEVSSDVWGAYMKSRVAWNIEDLISIEGNLQISTNTRGGTWLGLNESTGCSIFARTDDDAPSMHCDLSPNGTTEYSTADLPIKFDTWYLIRIDYDPITREQKYYLDNTLIGKYTPKNVPDLATLSFGAWREQNQSVNAFIDNIVVKTKP